jgi:hypothetical protein
MLETVTLNLNLDPSLLPEGVDPTTSEGKAAIRAALLQGLTRSLNTGDRLRQWDDGDAIAEALLADE